MKHSSLLVSRPIHNPNISEVAKEGDADHLEHMGDPTHPVGTLDESGHEVNRVIGGYKANLHSSCPCPPFARHSLIVRPSCRRSPLTDVNAFE